MVVASTEFAPLVYLPGAKGRGGVWRPIAERLATRRRPVLCDYADLGAAPADAHLASVGALVAALSVKLPERFDLVSLSAGAVVALRLAIEQPSRVRRLVLVTPATGVDVRALGGVEWREALRARRSDRAAWFLEDREDVSERLGEVVAPTLLVCGDADLICPVAVGEYLCGRIPAARLEVIRGATHDLEQEHADLLASLIEAHLRR